MDSPEKGLFVFSGDCRWDNDSHNDISLIYWTSMGLGCLSLTC